MDIAAISIALSQNRIQEQVSTSVLKMAIETQEQTMAQMLECLPAVSMPHLGQSIDVYA